MGNHWEGHLTGQGLRAMVVQSRFNSLVGEKLMAGAVDTLARHGVDPKSIHRMQVPGAFELGSIAGRIVDGDAGDFDLVVFLGVVVRGETPHFDYVCQAATRGIADAAQGKVAVGFGLLTTDTMEQALDRAGGKAGNKGAEAAMAALEMADLNRRLTERK